MASRRVPPPPWAIRAQMLRDAGASESLVEVCARGDTGLLDTADADGFLAVWLDAELELAAYVKGRTLYAAAHFQRPTEVSAADLAAWLVDGDEGAVAYALEDDDRAQVDAYNEAISSVPRDRRPLVWDGCLQTFSAKNPKHYRILRDLLFGGDGARWPRLQDLRLQEQRRLWFDAELLPGDDGLFGDTSAPRLLAASVVPAGLRLDRVERGSILAALGFVSGHVVVAVNGHPSRTIRDAVELRERLRHEETLLVDALYVALKEPIPFRVRVDLG